MNKSSPESCALRCSDLRGVAGACGWCQVGTTFIVSKVACDPICVTTLEVILRTISLSLNLFQL